MYDNTRIIIVSDHGFSLNIEGIDETIVSNNAVLLFKDFNAKGGLRIGHKFMTTADVPYLAANGLVKPLINPLTGREILFQKGKENGVDITTTPVLKVVPNYHENKDRTYLYDEEVNYLHVDQNNIKQMIKIDPEIVQ